MPTPHDTFREQLLDLAYGELGRREEKALRAHLQTCAACRAELAQLEGTRGAMAALGQEPAPERGVAILLAAAREAARERQPKPFLPAWLWGTSLGAVAAVAVAVVSYRLAVQAPEPFQLHPADERAARSAPAEVAPAVAEAAPAAPPAAPAASGGAAPEPEARLAREANRAGQVGDAGRQDARAKAPAPAARPALAATPRKERSAVEGEAKPAAPSAPARDDLAERDRWASADAAPAPARAGAGSGAVASASPASSSSAAQSGGLSAAPPPQAPAGAEAAPRDQAAASAVAGPAEKREVAAARAKGAASRAAEAAAVEDPIARHQRLQVAGRLHTASASFPGCPAEASRELDLDEQGRVVRYTRRGTAAGESFQAELFYGEDGRLGAVRYRSQGRVHELRPSGGAGGGAGVPAFALEPRQASDAGLGAPPRCGG